MRSHSQQGDCPLAPPLPFTARAINYTARLGQPVVSAANYLCIAGLDQPLFLHLQEVFPMESDPAEHLCK